MIMMIMMMIIIIMTIMIIIFIIAYPLLNSQLPSFVVQLCVHVDGHQVAYVATRQTVEGGGKW